MIKKIIFFLFLVIVKVNSYEVIELNDSNFASLILESNDMWIVDFYAPWCKHCQELEPEWNNLPSLLKGAIKVGKFDCTKNPIFTDKIKITGFPSIKGFKPGDKNATDNVVPYENHDRSAISISEWAYKLLDQTGYISETPQLTNQEQFQLNCGTNSCLIAILPPIWDSNSNERNRYINYLSKNHKFVRGKPINIFWAQGTDFFDLENELGLSNGYPVVVTLNINKKIYSIMKESYEEENLTDYVKGVLIGKGPFFQISKVPKLKTVSEWDGNDYIPPKEENILDEDL